MIITEKVKMKYRIEMLKAETNYDEDSK